MKSLTCSHEAAYPEPGTCEGKAHGSGGAFLLCVGDGWGRLVVGECCAGDVFDLMTFDVI